MSKQEIDKMNKYDESNKNLNQSKLNPNLFYNGLTDNSKGNNINPVFINNVFINNSSKYYRYIIINFKM